ncbi:MAG: BamA/TamA family outer membrane protein [Bacteroidota bacterium]
MICFRYIFILLLFTACNTTKYLQEGEALLEENLIELEKGTKLPSSFSYDLSTLPDQQENKRFLFIPREWLYFKTKDTVDASKLKVWLYRKHAEVPSIFDEDLAEEATVSMRNYLLSKGYYDASVSYEAESYKKGKKVKVHYKLLPGERYVIDTSKIISADSVIQALLKEQAHLSLLQRGRPVTLELYDNEVTRIISYLRNNGYAGFNRSYIAPLRADSTGSKINLELEVLLKSDSTTHQAFTVGEVQVYPDFDPLDSLIVVKGTPPTYDPESRINYVQDTLIDGIRFFKTNWRDTIKAEDIISEIRLRTGMKYSLRLENLTNNNLNQLGVFRFISIKSEIDSLQDSIIHYKIYLTRNKPIGLGFNLDFTYSDQNFTTNSRLNLVGFASGLSFKLRNALKGAELLTNSISAGAAFEPVSINNRIRRLRPSTYDLNIESQLNIPRFTDYFGLWKWIGRKKKEDGLYDFLVQNANTEIQASYNFLDRRQFYAYQLFNLSFGYRTQLKRGHQLELQHFGINYFNPNTDGELFEDILVNNPFLANSFGQQFFTGALLRNVNYAYTNTRSKRSFFVNANLELSGIEVQTANAIYNGFALDSINFSIGNIDFSRYALLNVDARYHRIFNLKNTLAFRFNFGIALPFGLTNEVPYVKQFYIGGPNSIRAFQAREVGPGSYCSSDVHDCFGEEADLETPFYQTGNLKLELNAEYRFDLFNFSDYIKFKGAFFLEAGNVWTTKLDEERPNAQFRFTPLEDDKGGVLNEAFYEQLALGTGFGIRLDINYVLIRLDMGHPLHTPYNEPTNRWTNINTFALDRVNYNLALNYPF